MCLREFLTYLRLQECQPHPRFNLKLPPSRHLQPSQQLQKFFQDLSVGFEELFANIFPLSRQDTAIDGLESSSPGNSTISERKAIDGQSSKDMDVSTTKTESNYKMVTLTGQIYCC